MCRGSVAATIAGMNKNIVHIVLVVLAVLAALYGIYLGVGTTHAYPAASFYLLLAITLEVTAKVVT